MRDTTAPSLVPMEMLLGRPALAPTHAELIASLVPPRAFVEASFHSYLPDATVASQAKAKQTLEEFATQSEVVSKTGRFRRRRRPLASVGWYLDGGFGVGKTHLLAATYNAWQGRKHYVSFSGLTSLVGALGFGGVIDLLRGTTLLAIDEFELDDPGDTVLISRLADELRQTGTNLVVTSNTLPTRLGEGRFGAEDFLREIQGLANFFQVLTIEGGDYRRRQFVLNRMDEWQAPLPTAADRVELGELVTELRSVHPIRYRGIVRQLVGLEIVHASPVEFQRDALLLCNLVDLLYDFGVPVRVVGIELEKLFPPSFLAGGFRQKYGRCLSRLFELGSIEVESLQRDCEGGA